MTQASPARSRADGVGPAIARAGIVVAVLGALAVGFATLTPSDQPPTADSFCLVCGDLGGVDVLLNVLLFMPLGAGLAMCRVPRWGAISAMSVASALIELSQLAIIPGRDASFGDLTMNSIGGVLGYAVGASLATLLLPTTGQARRLSLAWVAAWILVQAAASFTLTPSPTEGTYYGQLARALGGRTAYPGRILSAHVGPLDLPDRDFGDSRAVAALMRRREATVDIRLATRASTSKLTSIARIADGHEQELMQLGADGLDVVFGVRTHAAALKLRPAYYRLAHAMPSHLIPSALPDTVRLAATYAPPVVRLDVRTDARTSSAALRVTPASAWRSIAPMTVYFDDSGFDALLDAAWLGCLLLPAGYWMRFALRRTSPFSGAGLPASIGAGLLYGYAQAPLLFGLATPAWWELAGGVIGMTTGAVIAHVVAGQRDQRPDARA